jgi:hypothetical protein
MAYELNALIADRALLWATSLPSVPLAQGKGLVPLDRDFWRTLAGTSQPLLREHGARHAPDGDFADSRERAQRIETATVSFARLAALVERLALPGAVAYVESDYWGGAGNEAAALWDHGALVLAPLVGAGAIDHALQRLGVTGGALHGEFAVLGLGRCRGTQEWRRSAGP